MKSKEDIFNKMREEMPWQVISENKLKPYILEAMQIYAEEYHRAIQQKEILIGYALHFNIPDARGNVILPSSINRDKYEQLKSSGNIIDYEIDEIGIKITRLND